MVLELRLEYSDLNFTNFVRISTRPVSNQYQSIIKSAPFNTKSLPDQYQMSTRSIPNQYQSNTKSVPNQYQTSTKSVPKQDQISTRLVPHHYQISTKSVPNQYQISARSVPNQVPGSYLAPGTRSQLMDTSGHGFVLRSHRFFFCFPHVSFRVPSGRSVFIP